MLSSSFWQSVKEQVINLRTLLFTLLIAVIYFSFSVLILNYRFIQASFLGNTPFFYKFQVIYILLQGSYTAFSPLDFYLLIFTSVLVGLNVALVIKIIRELTEERSKLTLVVGGSGLVGVAVAGCTSCGFSLLSLLGLGGALSIIPFGGLGLHTIIIALLILSLLYSLKTYHYKIACKIR
jgi:hypothetical protein